MDAPDSTRTRFVRNLYRAYGAVTERQYHHGFMKSGAPGSFGAQLKALREAAGFTQEELATIAGLSVHAVSALERGQRRRPHADTVRALSSALDLTETTRDVLLGSARGVVRRLAVDELSTIA